MDIVTSQLIASPTLQDLLVDKTGMALSNGQVYFYVDGTQILKNWYYQTGTEPGMYNWIPGPNPMTLSAAGTFVDVSGNDVIPFWYPYDETDNTVAQSYYIEVYNQFGTLEFTRSNFPFVGNIQNNVVETLDQYVINNRFWRNVKSANVTNITTSATSGEWTTEYSNSGNTVYYQKLCPSQHDGFSMPDFNYIKNVNGASETITFEKFPLQQNQILENDITPEWYIQHNCTSVQTGETLKVYQFPISLHINTLASQEAFFTIQAQWVSGVKSISFAIYQYLGTEVDSPMPLGFYTISALEPSWHKYTAPFSFPAASNSTGPLTLSAANNDALYLQIQMPTSAVFEINFCLPTIYLGPTAATNSFQTYDQIDSVISNARTGDVRTSLNSFFPFGWVPMSNGTICNNGSITPPNSGNGIAYQGPDAFPLFNLIWNSFKAYDNAGANYIAQMYDAAGNPASYGATAYADWKNLKQLSLTQSLGSVILGTVPMPALPKTYKQTFTATPLSNTFTVSSGLDGFLLINSPLQVCFGMVVTFSGGSLPSGITASTPYYAVPSEVADSFYVATSLLNAQSFTCVAYAAGSGSITSSSLLLSTTDPVILYSGTPIIFSNASGALPTGIDKTHVFYAVPCSSTTFCVGTEFNNVITGNLISYIDSGSGTNTVIISLAGSYVGEYEHTQIVAELANHTHLATSSFTYSFANTTINTPSYFYKSQNPAGSTSQNVDTTITAQGGNIPSNVIQPSTYYNIFIKL